MDLSKYMYVANSGDKYVECVCDVCHSKPAVKIEADCHGDALCLCKVHWEQFYKDEILDRFDNPEPFMVEVEPGVFKQVFNKYAVVPKSKQEGQT